MLLGIISYIYFSNVLILSARIKFFDRYYGHDKVMMFHGNMAFIAVILALLHRYFKIKVFPFINTQITLGTTAFIIFLSIITLSLLFMAHTLLLKIPFVRALRNVLTKKLKIDYSVFKFIHNFMIAALVFLLFHAFLASSTQESWWRMIFMAGWAGIALILWLRHKIIKPLIKMHKKHKIKSVVQLSDAVTEITFSRDALKKYKPGQFVFVRFPGSKWGIDEHPFTLSSSPSESYCSITAKSLGNFTSRLKTLKKGDCIAIDGPYGIFTPDKSDKPLVFIAGGIGITPFYSILKEQAEHLNKLLVLFWGVQHRQDLVYHEQLTKMASANRFFRYIPVIAETDNSEEFEKGFISNTIIEKYLENNPRDNQWYICGPPGMKNFILKNLSELGVKRSSIFQESFAL